MDWKQLIQVGKVILSVLLQPLQPIYNS